MLVRWTSRISCADHNLRSHCSLVASDPQDLQGVHWFLFHALHFWRQRSRGNVNRHGDEGRNFGDAGCRHRRRRRVVVLVARSRQRKDGIRGDRFSREDVTLPNLARSAFASQNSWEVQSARILVRRNQAQPRRGWQRSDRLDSLLVDDHGRKIFVRVCGIPAAVLRRRPTDKTPAVLVAGVRRVCNTREFLRRSGNGSSSGKIRCRVVDACGRFGHG